MTEPSDIRMPNVRVYARQSLVRTHGCYALTIGSLHPRVLVDRDAELLPGFEALMYHEGTHAFEYHTLLDNIIVGSALVAITLAISLGLFLMFLWLPASVVLWLWWRREREIRADAVALYGAGLQEYRAMLLMHAHPRGWFGRWCYGKNVASREVRTKRRCERRGWVL